jgi:hypothetical protein
LARRFLMPAFRRAVVCKTPPPHTHTHTHTTLLLWYHLLPLCSCWPCLFALPV